MSSKDYDYIMKAVVIGDGGVGKTSLIKNFCEKKFSESYIKTIGANFFVKTVETEGKKVRMQIWDFAGQDYFGCVREPFYSGSKGSLIVFDLTRYNTFTNIHKWLEELYKNIKPVIPTVPMGNKVDLKDSREVGHEIAVNYQKELSKWYEAKGGFEVPYFETSAKIGDNVENVFIKLAEGYMKTIGK